jgi:hypothetical protein
MVDIDISSSDDDDDDDDSTKTTAVFEIRKSVT